ncbi:MAG: N-methylhydantoinase, partial [Acidimicrobiaceae bacterium]|nr:N-methylhydantoinase [Acidimicrobiaceae bacterium]
MKVLSSPDDPAVAVLEGVATVAAAAAAAAVAAGAEGSGGSGGRPSVVAHGTTVATNALLERRGARVALYSTEGHADIIEIARQVRPSLYDPFLDRPEPLVPRALRFEVPGRLDGAGNEIEPVRLTALPIPDGVGAAAVVLLHADRNAAH